MQSYLRARFAAVSLCLTLMAMMPCVGQTGSCAKVAGTWRIAKQSSDGRAVSGLGDTQTHIKHVTDTHFTWVTYKNDTKQLTSALGGSCALHGDSYVETPQYGLGRAVDLLRDKPQKFTSRLDGNRWYLNGQLSNGEKLEEVWERVKE